MRSPDSLRIAVVEDDPIMGESLIQRLALEGYDAVWCQTGGQALEALRQRRPDLMVCDIRLPDMSGEELFGQMLASTGPSPTLFITALCGIVGLKPTYGAISRYGMIAFASSLDQCGPLTRDVTDAAILLRAMEGRDPCDSTSIGIAGGVELPEREDLRGLRFGLARDFSHHAEGVEAGVGEVFERTLATIRELGGEIVECDLPHAHHGLSAYYVIAPAEASANLARYDGVRYGLRAEDGDLVGMYERTRSKGFGPEVKRRIMLGTYALSAGYYEAYYGQAQRVRTRIAEDFARAFERCDLLITPTSPSVAFELGARAENPMAMYLSDYFTVPMSLAGIPAISIPAGLAEPDGGGPEMPVGFQIAAPAFGESVLIGAAYALERGIAFDGRPRGLGHG